MADDPMREDLDLQLEQLRAGVRDMGERADAMLAGALRALTERDLGATQNVFDADRGVDHVYEQTQHGVLALVALHAPVGHDLRLATALIHVSLHLERMADYAVNVARVVQRTAGHPGDDDVVAQLATMGEHARTIGRQALTAFDTDDAGLAESCARLDDEVDRLDEAIFHRLVALAAEGMDHLEWATRMIRLARHLERYGDHGVDIAEQAVFVATGSAVDLSRRDG
jgi:phosphate transport system protein